MNVVILSETTITEWTDGSTIEDSEPFTLYVTLAETSDVSTTIITVTATTDANSVSYSLVDQSYGNQFVVSNTGVITLGHNQKIDREGNQALEVIVR